MNAKELFHTDEERRQVKAWLDEVGGLITKVVDEDGKVLYENKMAFKETI